MERSRRLGLWFSTLTAGAMAATPARAASLQKLNQSDWVGSASNIPAYVTMYLYVPDKLAARPPIVVAPHHCQGTGPGTFSEMSSLVSIANSNGFIMIFPEATGENCWDAGSARALQHNGGGDTQAIVLMVQYALSKYSGDPARVYSVGGSSGGIMTEALLGVYPDVFMAGVSLMGVPCGCWAQGYNDTTGTGTMAQWSAPCASGMVTHPGQDWGTLVRSFYPEYRGHRPRLQHWHGTADMTIAFTNMAEDAKEWTNLLGLSATPSGMDTPASGTTHQFWKNACGYTVYETFALAGVGHAVPFDGNAVAAYFGLDRAGGQDPETAACPGAVPGGALDGGGSDGDATAPSAGSEDAAVSDAGPPPIGVGSGSSSGAGSASGSGGGQAANGDGAGTAGGSPAADGGDGPSPGQGVADGSPSSGVATGGSSSGGPSGGSPPAAPARSGCSIAHGAKDSGALPLAFWVGATALLVQARRRRARLRR